MNPRLRHRFPKLLCLLLLALLPLSAEAQGRRGRGNPDAPLDFGGGGRGRNGAPGAEESTTWPVDPAFKEDLFTFLRLEYPSYGGGYGGGGYGGGWAIDVPDADTHLALRLHQFTSLKVRPVQPWLGTNSARITPENLARFPFVYIVEPGRLALRAAEARALREYLLKGGFLMLDDFWADDQWRNAYGQMKLIFPDREIKELSLEHPIFHSVFDMRFKPQMPAIDEFEGYGTTWEPRWRDYRGGHDSHYYGIFDDKGRMMVFIGHNNDFGDGWERENLSPEYFRTFSEKQAYPMMINILFYAMTH